MLLAYSVNIAIYLDAQVIRRLLTLQRKSHYVQPRLWAKNMGFISLFTNVHGVTDGILAKTARIKFQL